MSYTVSLPKVKLLTTFRLGLYYMGLGMMSILTLGVLNRVMIQELAIPASTTAVILAVPLFVSPARVWFGQMSDAKPIRGYHRTGYIWLGSAIYAIAPFIAVQLIWQLGSSWHLSAFSIQTYGWIGLITLVFAIFGLAIDASATAFTALLVDISDEDNRSKLVGIVWSMLIVGIVVGSIASSIMLKQITPSTPIATLEASINRLFIIFPAIVLALALLATVGVEKKYSRYSSRSKIVNRSDKITLGVALRVLSASPQTGLFFTFLLLMTINLFVQEPIVEPLGAKIFGMSLAETSKLPSFLGIGNLIGLNLTGFLIVPRLGKERTTRIGCILVAICIGLIGLSGFTHNQMLLRVALLLFGLASGIATTGAISLMLELTAAETAGTFIGAWGLAHTMARGIAVASGGILLDVGRSLFHAPVLAYGLVFGLQVLGMVLAIWFLGRVDVAKFRTQAQQAVASVLPN
jgi:BCD family chlorophyll transporter-like MFS transporter